MFFKSNGLGHPQNVDLPNFFPDFKSSILGLSNELHNLFYYHGLALRSRVLVIASREKEKEEEKEEKTLK